MVLSDLALLFVTLTLGRVFIVLLQGLIRIGVRVGPAVLAIGVIAVLGQMIGGR